MTSAKSILYFDFETTNLDYGSARTPGNRILHVAWAIDDGPVQTCSGDLLKAKRFWKALNAADLCCAFNSKFEMHWLHRWGFDVDTKVWHDPMLGEKVLLGNIQALVNLDAVSVRYGLPPKDRMIDSMMKAGLCPSEMPQKRLLGRCIQDVASLRSLHKQITKRLHERGQVHLYRNRCDFAVVLMHIEAEGMLLDKVVVKAEYHKAVAHLTSLTRELDMCTGGINMNSPDQKAHFLYGTLKFKERKGPSGRILRNKPSKQFPKGRPKTDKDTLTWLAGQCKTERQAKFIELSTMYSKANAALSKNLEFFQGVCKQRDGRFYGQFNQTVTATHRLSSTGVPIAFEMYGGRTKSVQFQNMPRAFKGCFKAPPGYKIAELDFPQLEFRVAAFLGQDKQAMEDILDPTFDAHIFSASKIYELDYDILFADYQGKNGQTAQKNAKKIRQLSKPHTFKPLYGGKKGTPGEETYYKEFAARYSGVAAEQENWLADVARTGEHRTAWGMTFRWNTFYDKRGVLMDKRSMKPVGPSVFNYPVQNLATAEIVPIAITALYKRCREIGLDVKLSNTVHDSVVALVKDDRWTRQEFPLAAKWAFTTAVYEHLDLFYGIDFNVPLGVEITTGDHWGEGTTILIDDTKQWRQEYNG